MSNSHLQIKELHELKRMMKVRRTNFCDPGDFFKLSANMANFLPAALGFYRKK